MVFMRSGAFVVGLALLVASSPLSADGPAPGSQGPPGSAIWAGSAMETLEAELVGQHGEEQRARLRRGMRQVAMFWRIADGDRETFEAFVRRHFATDPAKLEALDARFERLLETLDGHLIEIALAFRRHVDLDEGPVLAFDELLAEYDPAAHINDDFFQNKLALVVLLNLPLTTLEERLAEGPGWTRRQWAEARLALRFSRRVPADLRLDLGRAMAEAARYCARYGIWMFHLVGEEGRLFPPKLRSLCHWGLRDQIQAAYADSEKGLAKQRTIQKIMERIVDQTIPEMVVDNPHLDWNPFTNEVVAATVSDSDAPPPAELQITAAREPDTRYATLLRVFRASRALDLYSPTAPTLMARRFDEEREISEAKAREMFEQVLSSPLLAETARLFASRLGRPLEPFDLWYDDPRPNGASSEERLDQIVAERYPTVEAFEEDIPDLLVRIGFSRQRAREIAERIVVDPARGSNHAWGARMRSARSHLRTPVGPKGMDYRGFRNALHELGHTVEQTISLQEVDRTLLAGVPNTAFAEALAFVFAARDLELLGVTPMDTQSRALRTLHEFWSAAAMSAVALVDMDVWHWMYEHPDAEPAELREATIRIAKRVWNTYHAPLLGGRDALLLGVFAHMIQAPLYLADYPIGHLIAAQVEEQVEKAGKRGAELERMIKQGRLTPDLWMLQATGSPVGSEALLKAAQRALARLREP